MCTSHITDQMPRYRHFKIITHISQSYPVRWLSRPWKRQVILWQKHSKATANLFSSQSFQKHLALNELNNTWFQTLTGDKLHRATVHFSPLFLARSALMTVYHSSSHCIHSPVLRAGHIIHSNSRVNVEDKDEPSARSTTAGCNLAMKIGHVNWRQHWREIYPSISKIR